MSGQAALTCQARHPALGWGWGGGEIEDHQPVSFPTPTHHLSLVLLWTPRPLDTMRDGEIGMSSFLKMSVHVDGKQSHQFALPMCADTSR